MFVIYVLLDQDKEKNMEYTFYFWSNKVDMPGPQKAARPLSWHIGGAEI